MRAQRMRLADAHHQGFGAQQDGAFDPTALPQRGWEVFADFTAGRLYDQVRGLPLTPNGTMAWGTTPLGGGLDFAAASSQASAQFRQYFPPSVFTMMALVRVGTVRDECYFSFGQNGDPNTYDRSLVIRSSGVASLYVYCESLGYPAGVTFIDGTTTLVAGDLACIVGTYDGTTYRLYVNGRLEGAAVKPGGYSGYSDPVLFAGYRPTSGGGTNSCTATILAVGVAPVCYEAGQVHELWQRPFGQVAPPRRRRVSVSGPITGTGAATLGALTGTGTGTLGITATGAKTLGTLTGTGAATLGITGSGAKTLGALVGSGGSTLAIAGTQGGTLGAVTGTAVGTLGITGAGAATLGALTGTGAAALGITGAGAATLGALTGQGAGTLTDGAPTDAAPDPIATSTIAWAGKRRRIAWDGEDRSVPWTGRPRTVKWRRDLQ